MKRLYSGKVLFLILLAFAVCLVAGCSGSSTVWVRGNAVDVTTVHFDTAPKAYYLSHSGDYNQGKGLDYTIPKTVNCMVFELPEEGQITVSVKTNGVSESIKFKTGFDEGYFAIIDPLKNSYLGILDVASFYSEDKRPYPMDLPFLLKPADAHVINIFYENTFMWFSKLPSAVTKFEGYKTEAYKVFFLKPEQVESISKEDLAKQLTLFAEKVEMGK
jgi:hypothetical protein